MTIDIENIENIGQWVKIGFRDDESSMMTFYHLSCWTLLWSFACSEEFIKALTKSLLLKVPI